MYVVHVDVYIVNSSVISSVFSIYTHTHTHLVADLFDCLHAQVFYGDSLGVFADPSSLWDLVNSERLSPLPTAGQTTPLHYGLDLQTHYIYIIYTLYRNTAGQVGSPSRRVSI